MSVSETPGEDSGPNMRAAVEAFCERKFDPGGPFHPDTPGPWKDSRKVRGSAQLHDEHFRACVALQAQYAYETFGKFPATVPTIFILMYLQSHHLDLEYYDTLFQPGAYLRTHTEHLGRWHGVEEWDTYFVARGLHDRANTAHFARYYFFGRRSLAS